VIFGSVAVSVIGRIKMRGLLASLALVSVVLLVHLEQASGKGAQQAAAAGVGGGGLKPKAKKSIKETAAAVPTSEAKPVAYDYKKKNKKEASLDEAILLTKRQINR